MAAEQDKRIGQTVSILRGDRTQQAVAVAMRERGWKWSQATVWSIEKGDRPLRLAEADDLAGVLGVSSASDFTSAPMSAHIKIGSHRASDAYRAMVASVREYLEVKEQLEIALKIAEDEGHQFTLGDEAARDSWVASDKPEEAVAQARFEHEQAGRNDIERMAFEGYEFEVRADSTYAVRFKEKGSDDGKHQEEA
jgi:hypothetical protein